MRRARIAVYTLAAVIAAAAPVPRLPARAGEPAFELGGWLPYWSKRQGVARVLERLSRFDHVSPFAFRVDGDGVPRDTPQITRPPWPELLARARAARVAVLPTVVWSDAATRAVRCQIPTRARRARPGRNRAVQARRRRGPCPVGRLAAVRSRSRAGPASSRLVAAAVLGPTTRG